MDDLQLLLRKAWQVRQEHFPPVLGVDRLQRTRALSLTGTACALDCAHCGRHYLRAMLPVAGLSPVDKRLAGTTSLLLSGGCDVQGRVPVTAHLDLVRALRPGRRFNWHTGLIGEKELAAIADLADVVSFDLVGDDATIAEVYGIEAGVEDYRAAYRRLRQAVRVIPHITIGLRGGRLSGERQALRMLQEEGAEAIVFLVFIPTTGTRYAGCLPPPMEEVACLLAEARVTFPDTPLLLGCMRPAGAYRRFLDAMALRAGINRMVKPQRATLELAAGLGLRLEQREECCALGLAAPPPPGLAEATTPRSKQEKRAARGPAKVETVRVSTGTEVVLGLRRRPMDAAPTTAYLMLDGGGCAMACAFCAQARGSRARADALSRVTWPAYSIPQVLSALRESPPPLGRVCIQVTLHRGAPGEVLGLVRQLRQAVNLPLSVAIRPPDVTAVGELLAAGVEMVGLGLDCASEAVYRQVKGPGWSRLLALVEEAGRHYPGHIRVHLMAGLGETEEELCRRMQWVYDVGGAVGLFAFTPLRGTPLECRPPPPLDLYRRMQAARYLLHNGLVRAEQLSFDDRGRLDGFGRSDVAALLADGEAFRTSGCPHCNRPYYNERPGGTLYNYPRPLTPEEAARALAEMGIGHGLRGGCP